MPPRMDRTTYMKAYWADYRSRKKLVKFWVTHDVAQELKRLGLVEGRRNAEMARILMEAGLHGQAHVPRAVERELRELNRLLKNVANNINQLVRYAHQTDTKPDPVAMVAHVRHLHDHVDAFVRRELGRSNPPADADQKHDA